MGLHQSVLIRRRGRTVSRIPDLPLPRERIDFTGRGCSTPPSAWRAGTPACHSRIFQGNRTFLTPRSFRTPLSPSLRPSPIDRLQSVVARRSSPPCTPRLSHLRRPLLSPVNVPPKVATSGAQPIRNVLTWAPTRSSVTGTGNGNADPLEEGQLRTSVGVSAWNRLDEPSTHAVGGERPRPALSARLAREKGSTPECFVCWRAGTPPSTRRLRERCTALHFLTSSHGCPVSPTPALLDLVGARRVRRAWPPAIPKRILPAQHAAVEIERRQVSRVRQATNPTRTRRRCIAPLHATYLQPEGQRRHPWPDSLEPDFRSRRRTERRSG